MSESSVERVYPPKLMFLVVNPIMRWLLGTPIGRRLPDLARMEFNGRKTGRQYTVVAALHDIDGRRAILTNSGWRHNFTEPHPIELVIAGVRHPATGTLEVDPDRVAQVYGQRIEELGVDRAGRRLGIKIHGTTPTHQQLADLARTEGLSVIYLDHRPDDTESA